MGQTMIDEYSWLHLAMGMIFRYFEVGLGWSFVIHTIFEITENSKQGVHFINTYLNMWPGGKPKADAVINSVGDTVFFVAGWLLADQIIKYYRE